MMNIHDWIQGFCTACLSFGIVQNHSREVAPFHLASSRLVDLFFQFQLEINSKVDGMVEMGKMRNYRSLLRPFYGLELWIYKV
jgi:hypothetical protein